jgi:cell division protein ZapB
MQNELNSLEGKLAQLIKLSQHLRAENHRLRQELASAVSQTRQSEDKIEVACQRIEHILEQLPEEME